LIAEVEATGKLADMIRDLARKVTGRNETHQAKRNILDPLMTRFGWKQASKADPAAVRG
jgi:hypothetical protein